MLALLLLMSVSMSAVGSETARSCLLDDSALGLTAVAYHSEPSHVYIGSPSILRLPSGELIVSADRFGSGFAGQPRNVSLYRDNLSNGTSWKFHAWIRQQYWSNLFEHDGAVWILGTASDGPAPIKISRSPDGLTWPAAATSVRRPGVLCKNAAPRV